MDFLMLPPEINSLRMFLGAGPGPMLAAAAAWDGLAGEFGSAASSFGSVTSGLVDAAWQGPAAVAMAAAAAPYTAWLDAAATQAQGAAGQALAGVSAFEAAMSAMVHPGMVSANRNQFVSLVISNLFGQNAPAIAAAEAQYEEMWAQDVSAMVGYHGAASAVATELAPMAQALQSLPGLPFSLGLGSAGGTGNLGGGNTGGNTNPGSGSVGGGNLGSGSNGNSNVRLGNTGNLNISIGNNGLGNIGTGTLGNTNMGFGTRGNNANGFGVTGDNQVGFGALNTGLGSMGLLISGLFKTGIPDGGSTYFGAGSAGPRNAGAANVDTADVEAVEAGTGAETAGKTEVAELGPLRPKKGFWDRGAGKSGALEGERLEAGIGW